MTVQKNYKRLYKEFFRKATHLSYKKKSQVSSRFFGPIISIPRHFINLPVYMLKLVCVCRKGVLTFEREGVEERVLFLASKFYLFEKRLGTKQSLDQVRFDLKLIPILS